MYIKYLNLMFSLSEFIECSHKITYILLLLPTFRQVDEYFFTAMLVFIIHWSN